MTLRICILGNSHVGAIKLGWDAIKSSHPDVELTFFASPGASLKDIEVKDGIVVSDSPKVQRSFEKTGGAESFDIRVFDAICLVGLRTGFRWLHPRSAEYRPAALASPGDQVISLPLLRDLLRSKLETSPCKIILDNLAQHIKAPIFAIPDPYLSLSVTDSEDGKLYREIVDKDWGGELERIYISAFEKTMGEKATPVFQPRSAIVKGFFSDPALSTGSVRLISGTREHDDDDHDHMNAEFGKLLVSALIESVRSKVS